MRSMTGFAAQQATWTIHQEKINVTMSMKSVNSRFLETTFKIPYALAHLEIDVLKLLRHELIRGNVLINIYTSNQTLFKGNISASISTAQHYIDGARLIQKQTGIQGTVSLSDIIALPNIFSTQEQLLDNDAKQNFLTLSQEVIRALIKEQEKEGAALLRDLEQRAHIINQRIHDIETLHESYMTQRKTTIIQELNGYTTDDNTVIEVRKATLYHLLDKIDIHEELVRFKSHMTHLQDLFISATIELGKRLDFILQELGREINTIAAKCSDATIGSRAIDIKVELEKMREQVQNIV